MTEDIGSDKHSKYSSQEVAVFAERMRSYERREKEASARDQLILDTLSKINQSLNGVTTQLAVGQVRMDQIDTHLESTDTTVENLRAVVDGDKRGPVALILGTISGLGTAATAIWVALKGGGAQ